jgi:DNA end-binding protein Ku
MNTNEENPMPRPVWSGSISFGLVNVQVKAYGAVRDHRVHFHQIDKGSGSRIGYQKIAKETGEIVSSEDIEMGYEVSKGRYVIFDPSEIEELRPKTTRLVKVDDFVDINDIDPVYYDKTFWLAPDGDAAAHAYPLLLEAMEAEGRIGVGTVVMRNNQYLAAIRPLDGALAMSTMRFEDQIVERDAIPGLDVEVDAPSSKELALATQIIESLSSEWDPSRYHDTYTAELRKLITAKDEGNEIITEEEPAGAKVIDLMAALEASVAAARSGNIDAAELPDDADDADDSAEEPSAAKKSPAKKGPATKKAPAKKGPAAEKGAAKKATAAKAPAAKKAPAKRRASA